MLINVYIRFLAWAHSIDGLVGSLIIIHGLVCLLSRGYRMLIMINTGLVIVALSLAPMAEASACDGDFQSVFTNSVNSPVWEMMTTCKTLEAFSSSFVTDCFFLANNGAQYPYTFPPMNLVSSSCATCFHDMMGTDLSGSNQTVNTCLNSVLLNNMRNDDCVGEVEALYRVNCASYAYPVSDSCSEADNALFDHPYLLVADLLAHCPSDGTTSYGEKCFTLDGTEYLFNGVGLSTQCASCIHNKLSSTVMVGTTETNIGSCLESSRADCIEAASEALLSGCASSWPVPTTESPTDTTGATTEANGSRELMSMVAILLAVWVI